MANDIQWSEVCCYDGLEETDHHCLKCFPSHICTFFVFFFFFFVHQDNDVQQADKYADLAIQSDRYNPAGEGLWWRTPLLFRHYIHSRLCKTWSAYWPVHVCIGLVQVLHTVSKLSGKKGLSINWHLNFWRMPVTLVMTNECPMDITYRAVRYEGTWSSCRCCVNNPSPHTTQLHKRQVERAYSNIVSRLTSQESKTEKSAKYCVRLMAVRMPGHLRWPAPVVCDVTVGAEESKVLRHVTMPASAKWGSAMQIKFDIHWHAVMKISWFSGKTAMIQKHIDKRAQDGVDMAASMLWFVFRKLTQNRENWSFFIQIPPWSSSILSALVNKGNCDFVTGEYEKAKEQYMEALSIEASCVEALFNMGESCIGIGLDI